MTEQVATEKPVVVVDIDGVLFNTPADAVTAANEKHGTNYATSDIFNHNAEHDRTKFVIDGEDQFHNFQLNTANYRQIDGAKSALQHLAKRATIIALTSRNYDMFYDITKQAVHDHFGNSISEVYFTTAPSNDQHREKGEIVKELGGKVLVDDAVKYCESAVAHGLPAVLLAQPYNETGHSWPPEYRATDWDDAVRLVEQELDRVDVG